jgi:uncharacterized protein (UPF0335 family)
MTKTLCSLIKLNKNKLDLILKDIDIKKSEKTRIEEKKQALQAETDQEINRYSATEFSFILEKYVENNNKIIRHLQAKINKLEIIITNLNSELFDQYSELKKFQVAFDNKILQEKTRIRKLEEKQIDEYNITNFSLNNSSQNTSTNY